MTTRRHGRPFRTATAGADLRLFLLTGIATVLLTRWLLARTGYPKLGGHGTGLHIAHMLWGGLLMAAGLVVLLVFLGRRVRLWGAVTGGVGFGLFIDEIGKVVSDGGGYLYRPAAGLIYLAFAGLVLLSRWLVRRGGPPGARARTARAADTALTGVVSGLTDGQRRSALRALEGSTRPVDVALVQLLECVETAPQRPRARMPDLARRAVARGRDAVTALVAHRVTLWAALAWTVLQGALLLVGAGWDLAAGRLRHEPEWGAVTGLVVCSAVMLGLAVAGVVRLRDDRVRGLGLLRASLLADLLAGQVFDFVVNQFSAVTNWLIGLCLLAVVSGALRRARQDAGGDQCGSRPRKASSASALS
ncbi:hypothetical protein P2Q00_11325 [Streptomyces coacervatus]|nr:hypothetical protein [Streptomyces coacervatus]MDF2266030.1 hypothetical protein [Streptomyces coacervatus]